MLQHKHLLVNAKVLEPLRSERQGIDFLTDLVKSIDMKIIQGPFASYVNVEGNRGLTAMVMIETSHIAFHIWDEFEPASLQFDLYTCGNLDPKAVMEKMKKVFKIVSMDYQLFDRETGFLLLEEGFE